MFDQLLSQEIELFSGESDDYLNEISLESIYESSTNSCDEVPDLDSITPGPQLLALVSSVRLDKLVGQDVVSTLQAFDRLVSHVEGLRYTAINETAHCVGPDSTARSSTVEDFAPEEIGAALALTRRAANDELGVALDLASRLPSVAAAMSRGDVTKRKAEILSRDTAHLEPETSVSVVEQILEEVPDLTTGELRARLRRLCVEANPEEAKDRFETSLSERKVVAEENAEGTAALVISQCSPGDIYAARDYINILAKRLKRKGDSRNIDQIRADVGLSLLRGQGLGKETGGGSVIITGDAATFAGLAERAMELGGYGPVFAEIGRKIARRQEDGEWTAVVTDPETGEPLDVVSIRRRPTARQRRKIRALFPTCVFPGCRLPARNCDLDHCVDFADGGETTVHNHVPLCRRHHRMKHEGGWRYRKINRTSVEWLSPLGRRYRSGRPP